MFSTIIAHCPVSLSRRISILPSPVWTSVRTVVCPKPPSSSTRGSEFLSVDSEHFCTKLLRNRSLRPWFCLGSRRKAKKRECITSWFVKPMASKTLNRSSNSSIDSSYESSACNALSASRSAWVEAASDSLIASGYCTGALRGYRSTLGIFVLQAVAAAESAESKHYVHAAGSITPGSLFEGLLTLRLTG